MTIHIRDQNSQSRLAARQPLGRLAGRGEQPAAIGFLNGALRDPFTSDVTPFELNPSESGYLERQNVPIDFRWAGSHYSRLPGLAADLVCRSAAVVVASNGSAAPLTIKTQPAPFRSYSLLMIPFATLRRSSEA
jgi:hypothetical protein